MSVKVLEHGVARGTHNNAESGKLVLDEHRFVTFLDELGAAHTIIVPLEHVIEDIAELIAAWRNGTLDVTNVKQPNTPVEQTSGSPNPDPYRERY